MPVTARTNEQGAHRFREDFDVTIIQQYPDGGRAETRYKQSQYTHFCTRYCDNSSPYVRVGTSLWKRPKNYVRGICDMKQKEGIWRADRSPGRYDQLMMVVDDTDFKTGFSNPIAFDEGVPIWAPELESEAIAKALAKMKDQEVSLGENLAEAKSTYNQLKESSLILIRALQAAKRRDLHGVWDALRDGRSAVMQGANLFLQWKYGWAPLASDIAGTHRLLTEQLKPALIVSASQKSQRESIGLISNAYARRELEGASYRQARCKLFATINPAVSRVMDRVGLSNPLSLAWNIIPYSFVVDWFVPVGNTLDGLAAPLGMDFLGGYTTLMGQTAYNKTLNLDESYWTSEIKPRSCAYKIYGLERRAYIEWPKPGLYAVNPFSSSHGQSAFALLIQKLRA